LAVEVRTRRFFAPLQKWIAAVAGAITGIDAGGHVEVRLFAEDCESKSVCVRGEIRVSDDLVRSQPIGEIGLLADVRFRF